MCGRYLLRAAPEDATHTPWEQYWQDIAMHLGPPRYNISPSQQAPVLLADTNSVACVDKSWGFKPSWSKYNPSINTRSESAFSSKMFKHSIAHKRCLVIADGFYEPKGPKTQKSRPWHLFEYGDQRLFTLAGIWLDSGFSILTCEPNSLLKPIHDRMPVILEAHQWQDWLNPELTQEGDIQTMLQPREYDGLTHRPVGDYVKKPGHEGPQCIEGEQPSLF